MRLAASAGAGGPRGPAGHRGGAAPGVRPAAGQGRGDRASADRAGMRLGAPHQGRGPGRGKGPGAVRPRIAALVIYLYVGQFLSKKPTAQALAELFGVPLSSGSVAALTARAAG